jgi:hypothetical protein
MLLSEGERERSRIGVQSGGACKEGEPGVAEGLSPSARDCEPLEL